MLPRDWPLVLGAGLLVLAGPVLAFQELAHQEADRAAERITGAPPTLATGFRDAPRIVMGVLVLLVGLLGAWTTTRALRAPRVRRVAMRLVVLLVAGLTLADLAWVADAATAGAAPGVRETSVVWLYSLAGVLVGGAAMRLAEVETAFS